ncbi:MAG TPA: L,D-transpeptidase family protein [Pirellulaceae bacterium]|nr:L,D-transpeptidase family protein [Pirellulaceae bacterium]
MVDTLKTSVVVVLLLAGLYCVYVVLNKPEPSSHELAWEAGADDPALQIELGVPEAGDAGSGSASTGPTGASSPATSWGSAPQAYNQTAAAPHTNHLAAANGGLDQNLANRHGLDEQGSGDRHSLPIPEPTTPAAPDLLSAPASPTTTNEVSDFDASNAPSDPNATRELSSPTATSNELREPASSSNDLESPTSRSGGSNRYSDYSPLRDELAAEVTSSDGPQAPTNSAQANVNDLVASEAPGVGANSFQSTMQLVQTQIEGEAWYDALLKLTSIYNDPSLSENQFSQVVDLLDPLAGKVIYSVEHLIEPPYQSQSGDTLMNVADRYEVPWQLLANINGIENPETLLAGRELKVVRGPFRAEVSLSHNELTLFVGKLYAGRFEVSFGNDPAPLPGQYQVNDKQPGRTYYAGNGQTIPIDDPNNPYGRVWVDLGNNLCIHGSSPNGASPGQGCIALTARDAGDVFGILSKGSSVVILP